MPTDNGNDYAGPVAECGCPEPQPSKVIHFEDCPKHDTTLCIACLDHAAMEASDAD